MNNFQLPNGIYTLPLHEELTDEKQIERVKKLINRALENLDKPTEYELCQKTFNYGMGLFEVGSHYGLNFHLKEEICVIFGTQRDIKYPHSIFQLKDINMAAEYFVWLVSDGRVSIDWSLYLEDLELKQSFIGKLFGSKS